MSQQFVSPSSVLIHAQPRPTVQGVSQIILAITLAIVGAFAFALFFYAVPVWDDLVRATRPVELGWWNYVVNFVYMHWQGRWASCGLESFVLPRTNILRFYAVLIGAVALVDIAAAYTVCRWFMPTASQKAVALVSASLLALLWAGMPSVGETVYWFTGAVENAMSPALGALLIIALLRYSESLAGDGVDPQSGRFDQLSALHSVIIIATLSIAAVFIVGLHELYGAMLALALCLGTFGTLAHTRQGQAAWIIVTLAAIAGLALVVAAPGNSERVASDGGHHARHLVYDLKIMMSQVRHFIPRWSWDPKMLAATLWVLFTPVLRSRSAGSTSTFPWRYLVPLVWLAMLAGGFFAPSWAFGEWMPLRTLSGVYIVFATGWLIIVHLWAPILVAKITRPEIIAASTAIIIFSMSLLLFGNTIASAHDFYNRIRPWHAATEDRYARLHAAAGKDALIPLLPKRPYTLLDGEITDNPGDYRNWATVSFFHLRSVRLNPIMGPVPPVPLTPTRAPGAGSRS